jgi:hypothetical protein
MRVAQYSRAPVMSIEALEYWVARSSRAMTFTGEWIFSNA